jgi:hypothetical protein
MTLGLGYRATTRLGPETTDGLVIMCSDRRYRAPAEEFVREHAQLTNYDVMALPGGIYLLSFADSLPKNLKLGMRMLRFIVQNHLPPRIILIGHANCSRYREGFASWLRRPGFSLEEKQRHDLKSVAQELRDVFPNVQVSSYFARAAADDSVEFEPA